MEQSQAGVGGQPEAKPRTWLPMALWSAGIVLALGLVWAGANAVGVYETRRVLLQASFSRAADYEVIAELGGPEKASRRLSTCARMPPWVVGGGTKGLAIYMLGACDKAGVHTLIRLLQSRDASNACGAVAGLEKFLTRNVALSVANDLDYDAALAALKKAADDVRPEVRTKAAEALRRMTWILPGEKARAETPTVIRGEEPPK